MNGLIPRHLFVLLFLAPVVASWAAEIELLQAPPTAPRYRLSNLRLEDDRFGRPTMVFDYSRTREGEGLVKVAVRSKSGPLSLTFVERVSDQSGAVRIGKSIGARGAYDYEFYLVTPAVWAGKNLGECLVSNMVRMGNPGPSPIARAWNAEEQAAFEKQQLADQTPEAPPAGYQHVGADTKLLPGMPIKASRFAEWVNAEVLALTRSGEVTIRYHDEDRGETLPREKWLVVASSVLEQGRSDPQGFKPSILVLPGGTAPLPRNAMPIDPDLELARGVPLLLERGTSWRKVFVLEDKRAIVRVRYADHPGEFDFDHRREELAIERDTRGQLEDPAKLLAFAKNVDKEDSFDTDGFGAMSADEPFGGRTPGGAHIINRNYPIKARIPRGAKVVPEGVELPPDTRVGYCWGWRWNNATVVEDQGSTVLINEDDDVSTFVMRVKRGQLIIKTATLRKLERQRKTAAEDLKKTLRTWTDSTGKFKVEARFVALEEEKVILKSATGREIKLPLSRLSEDDQALLSNLELEADNPFE